MFCDNHFFFINVELLTTWLTHVSWKKIKLLTKINLDLKCFKMDNEIKKEKVFSIFNFKKQKLTDDPVSKVFNNTFLL